MSFLDDDSTSSNAITQTPLQPVVVKPTPRSLPPDVLIRIFQRLPVPSLANVALVSRRFKVLAYDDEVWDAKLRVMLEHDTGALAATLGMKLG